MVSKIYYFFTGFFDTFIAIYQANLHEIIETVVRKLHFIEHYIALNERSMLKYLSIEINESKYGVQKDFDY